MAKRWRWPKRLRWTPSYRIQIVLDREEMDKGSLAESDHNEGYSVVRLDPRRVQADRLDDLIHELDHCWVEYKEYLIDWITHRERR